ncbi:MAG: single-stranded DNA-binding protein, partial [Candidatus Binatia bacterium]
MDLNKVMIIGRLTQDPEARTTPQGVAVTTFSVATNRVWKDQQGNQKDMTEYHNVVAWRRLAEICAQYLSKGRQVYVEGHLQT